jgi:hypothetical protein
MRTGHLAGIITLLAALTACGSQTGSPVTASTPPIPTSTSTSGNQPSAEKQPDQAVQQTTTKTTSSSNVVTTRPPQATATISVKKQPTCPVHGTPDAPFTSPGTDVVIEWKVTGATGAAIAVDNPNTYGAYGMYGTTGQLTLAFGCTDKPGKTTHTYTVWPTGNKNVSKTISVSATNNP